jgi:hypothetical protein
MLIFSFILLLIINGLQAGRQTHREGSVMAAATTLGASGR